MNKKLVYILEILQKLYPDPQTELHYSTPFQFVVAVMLSAQATDVQVNKVTKNLFKIIKKPKDLVKMGIENFESAISSINYYKTKAKHIYMTALLLMENEKLKIKQYMHGIPDTVEELMKFPGIGLKTAKLIVHVLYDKPFIAVDTHIHRVSNRLGIVNTSSPEKTSQELEKLIPNTYKDFVHHALVLFGRYHCKAVKPKCQSCKLKKVCEYYKSFGMRGEM